MRQSQLFTKTRKEAPADEVSKNAQLLIKAGYVHKEMAGVYSMLPLGVMVINKISAIIREEMNNAGGLETQSSALQSKDVWEKTGRFSDDVVDNWFKTNLKSGGEVGLAFTHEEPTTNIMKNFIHSYKDLPVYSYDIRSVFRNEMRAKSGVIRGREFFWKALYSFSKDKTEHDSFYEKITQSYKNVFNRVGLGDSTYFTFASGGTFSKYSHEFQTVCEAGEDIIYVNKEKGIAINKEVYTDEVLNDLGVSKDELIEEKAVEVGNIFSLGYKFSEPIGLTYTDQDGNQQNVFMGSYGIGISRLMGVIAEMFADDKGLVWPKNVAPFSAHLVLIGDDEESKNTAEKLYADLNSKGIQVLFDDRVGPTAGEKFSDSDLLGMPIRIIVSKRSLENGGVEIKNRMEDKSEVVSIDKVFSYVQ